MDKELRIDSLRENGRGRRPAPEIRSSRQCINVSLVCLNFKVPLRVRQLFKVYAARHNMTMTELVLLLLDDCMSAEVNSEHFSTSTEQEIEK